jgi:hypothetical protein
MEARWLEEMDILPPSDATVESLVLLLLAMKQKRLSA